METTIATLMNATTEILSSTAPPRTYEVPEDEPLGVSIGIFIGILSGSLVFILLVVGLCILSHVFYMKFIKKPWYVILFFRSKFYQHFLNKSNFFRTEKASKSVWFIEPEKKEVKKEQPKPNPVKTGYDEKSISSSIISNSSEIAKKESYKIDEFKQPQTQTITTENVNLGFVDSNHNILNEKAQNNQFNDKSSNNRPNNFKISQV